MKTLFILDHPHNLVLHILRSLSLITHRVCRNQSPQPRLPPIVRRVSRTILLRWLHWLDVPDHLGILVDTSVYESLAKLLKSEPKLGIPVTAEESHSSNRRNRLGQPFLLVLVRLVDQLLRIDVALKVI